MEIGGLLQAVRGVQQSRLLEVVANQLQPHGHTALAKACGHAHAGQTGQRCGQGEDVGQVVGQRVAAVLMIPAAHMDWLRPGIMLYGASPFADLSAAELGLKPAMTLSAQLIAVREVAVGESVGYGAGWVAERPSRIGTVSCGYADGYPRHAPSGTPLCVGGRRAPLAGRVSMDMLSVDLTDLPEATVGDAVELWGANLPVDEVAAAAGTIGYELLTKVTARVPRRYKA